MRVLSIGTDRGILNSSSESAKRHMAYGMHFDELNIIIFSKGGNSAAKVTLSAGVHAYPTQSRNRLLYGIDAFRIARLLPKPDVVTVQDPFETGLIGWIIARIRGARLHVQVHADFLAPEFPHGLNRLRAHIARFVLSRADHIRVVSYRIQEGILKARLTEAPITVLPIYVDIQKFKSAHAGVLAGRFSKFTTRLLVVARLEKEKNVILALESFAKAAPHDACLIIVGDGRERRVLLKRASRLGIGGRVFFEGKTDALPYYALADLILVPSLFEGYGRVIIEALAAEKPVIATDVGIAREAGAIVTETTHFTETLADWFENGSREGHLQHYPYTSFEQYVEAYTANFGAPTERNAR